MAAAQAAENHGEERGLTWYLRWGIYASIPTWTQSLAATEALSLKYPLIEHLSNDYKDRPIQHETSDEIMKLCDETGNPVLSVLERQHGRIRQQHDQNLPMEGKPL